MDDESKPRLLVLTSTYPRWGGDHEPGFVHELSRRLLAWFDITVITPHAQGAQIAENLDGVRVVRYRYAPSGLESLVHGGGIASHLKRSPWKYLLLPGFFVGQYYAAKREIARTPVSVIHAHWLLPQGWIAKSLAKRFRVPYLVTSHGGDLYGLRGRFLTALKQHVAASAAAMTVVSNAMQEEASRLGISPPAIEVLPMGVDMRHRFVPNGTDGRDGNRLLFVGRLVPKKGLRYLIDAMPMVLERHPGATLDIAGFGPELVPLQRQVATLGINDRVNFLGAIPQQRLPSLYRRAALFVAPFVADESGDQEGMPVALMEAIGCGCPAIVGDVVGVRDLLGKYASEICVQPSDPMALAAAVSSALEEPEAVRWRAAEIRKAAAAKVDWDRISTAYAELLKSCSSKAGMAPGAP